MDKRRLCSHVGCGKKSVVRFELNWLEQAQYSDGHKVGRRGSWSMPNKYVRAFYSCRKHVGFYHALIKKGQL